MLPESCCSSWSLRGLLAYCKQPKVSRAEPEDGRGMWMPSATLANLVKSLVTRRSFVRTMHLGCVQSCLCCLYSHGSTAERNCSFNLWCRYPHTAFSGADQTQASLPTVLSKRDARNRVVSNGAKDGNYSLSVSKHSLHLSVAV